MLVFYDAAYSGNTWKVRLLLKQLELPHSTVQLDLFKGEVRTPGFRGRNHQRVEWNLEQVLVQCQDPSRFALELRIQPAKKIAVKLLTQCSRY